MFFNPIKKNKKTKGDLNPKFLKKPIKAFHFFLTKISVYFVVKKCLKTTEKKKGDKFMLCSLKNIKKNYHEKEMVLLVEPLFQSGVKITTQCDL